jgi:tetratricopeptide (TPR) repeat protein
MTLSWFFKSCLLIAMAMLAAPAWSHPDLLLQIEELNLALASRPADVDLLARRGDLHRQHEDYAAAAVDLAAARAAQPDYPLLDLYEGMLLLDTRNPAGAEQLFSRFLQDHPNVASAWILRARARLALGLAYQAAADYAQAILYADLPSPELYRDWALALVAAGEDHWNEARDVVDIGLGLFPREVSLLALGTDIVLAENLPGEAENYINRLSQPIARLPRWQSRTETMKCLQPGSAGGTASLCQSAAVNALRSSMPNER